MQSPGFHAMGTLVAEGSPSAIKARQPGHLLELIVDQPQRAADVLKSQGERWRVSLFGARLHVITDEDFEAGRRATVQALEAQDIHVIDANEARFSLEDVFITVVEQARGRVREPAGA